MNLTGSAPSAMRATLSAVTSVSSLESNTGLYAEVLNAYGFNTKTTPQSNVTLALESNLSDPNSFANRPANAAYRALAEDFTSDRTATSPVSICCNRRRTSRTRKWPTIARCLRPRAIDRRTIRC